MTEYDEQIAKVNRTDFGVEDHGILSINVDFEFGGSSQGTGGYSLDGPTKFSPFKGKYPKDRVGSAWGMEFLHRLMLALDVGEWSDIPGRTVYVLRAKGDTFGKILGIRPLPTEKGEEFIFDDLKVLIEDADDD